MEALLILISSFLFLPVLAGIGLLLEALVAIVSVPLELVLLRAESDSSRQKRRFNLPPKLVKGVQRLFLGLLAFTLVLLVVVNFFFLEQIVRFAAGKASESSGVEISYSEMSGNLFTGAFSFSDIELRRQEHTESDFNISLGQIKANLAVTRLLFGKRVLDSFSISQGMIDVSLKERSSTKAKDGIGVTVEIGEDHGVGIRAVEKGEAFIQEMRHPKFVFNRMELVGLQIEVDDSANGRGTYVVQVDTFEAEPLRSHFLWFDILFRSNHQGTLNHSELTISNRKKGQRRYTAWRVLGVSAASLNSLVGGPFMLFEEGKIDVEVSDDWELEKSADINMDWKLRITDGKAALPDAISGLLKPFAESIVERINQKNEPWEIGFTLNMSESQFRGSVSLDAKQLWGDALPSILEALADEFGFSRDAVKEGANKIFGGLKRLMESRNTEGDEPKE